MISNIGNKFSFYCLNHDEPIKMIIKEGNNQFYACPKYMLQDEKHPDGYVGGFETACSNRLSFDDAGDIIMKFSSIMTESLMNGEFADWDNFEFDVKRIHCKILHYGNNHIDVGVINNRTVSKK